MASRKKSRRQTAPTSQSAPSMPIAPAPVPPRQTRLRTHTQLPPTEAEPERTQAKRRYPGEDTNPPRTKKSSKIQKKVPPTNIPVQYATPANTTFLSLPTNHGYYIPNEHTIPNHQVFNVPLVPNSTNAPPVYAPVPDSYGRSMSLNPPPPSATPLPPYLPTRQHHVPVVECISDSDGKEEILVIDVNSGAGSQFQTPVPVLEHHWLRNGKPQPPSPHRFPSNMTPVPPPPPSISSILYPTPIRPTPIRPTPIRTPMTTTVNPVATPGPIHPPPPSSSIVPVQPSMPPPVAQLAPGPAFELTGDPTRHGSWPPAWRRLLEIAWSFALNDLLFVHGFPSTFALRGQAGESLTNAWEVYKVENGNAPLSKPIFDDYRDQLRRIVINNVRNHRAKLRDSIIDILKVDPALVGPGSSTETIAERVECLLNQYRFLDAPYGTIRTPDVMYSSATLSKVLTFIYGSQQWRTAMDITYSQRNAGYTLPLGHERTVEDNWFLCPPPSLISFAGTLMYNALQCCGAGLNGPRVSLTESDYRPVYASISTVVERDWYHPELGGYVQSQIERSILTIQLSQPPTHN